MSQATLSLLGKKMDARLCALDKNAAWLAKTIHVQRSTISRILHGERPPTPEMLSVIALALGISFEDLVANTEVEALVRHAAVQISGEHYQAVLAASLASTRERQVLEAKVRALELSLCDERDRLKKLDSALWTLREDQQLVAQQQEELQLYQQAFARVLCDLASLQTQCIQQGAKCKVASPTDYLSRTGAP